MLWGKTAESLNEYSTKGKQIYVEGSRRRGSGTTRTATSATRPRSAAIASLLGGMGGGGGRQQPRTAGTSSDEHMIEPGSELTDDDIPF